MRKIDRELLTGLEKSVRELTAAVGELSETQNVIQGRLDEFEKELKQERTAARNRTRTVFAEVEDLLALYRDIDPDGALPRMRGWAASPELLRFLYEEVVGHKRARVMECGSGTTTVILAYAVRALGSGKVVALEHSPRFAGRTRHELSERGLTDWADVVDAKLSEVELGEETWQWYDPEAIPEGDIDLLLVDGPPGPIGPEARYPAVPLLADRLGEGAMVVLDDAKRADEQRVAKKWVERYPRFETEQLKHDRGTILLRAKEAGA